VESNGTNSRQKADKNEVRPQGRAGACWRGSRGVRARTVRFGE
jgi:hypothetical protein